VKDEFSCTLVPSVAEDEKILENSEKGQHRVQRDTVWEQGRITVHQK
jgi:hypothetical protein